MLNAETTEVIIIIMNGEKSYEHNQFPKQNPRLPSAKVNARAELHNKIFISLARRREYNIVILYYCTLVICFISVHDRRAAPMQQNIYMHVYTIYYYIHSIISALNPRIQFGPFNNSRVYVLL